MKLGARDVDQEVKRIVDNIIKYCEEAPLRVSNDLEYLLDSYATRVESVTRIGDRKLAIEYVADNGDSIEKGTVIIEVRSIEMSPEEFEMLDEYFLIIEDLWERGISPSRIKKTYFIKTYAYKADDEEEEIDDTIEKIYRDYVLVVERSPFHQD